MNTLDAIKSLYENTELLKSSVDNQVQVLTEQFLPKLVATTLSGNPVLRIMVIEDLFNALSGLLKTNPCTPDLVRSIATSEEGLQDDILAAYASEVNKQLAGIEVESNKIGAFLPQSEVLLENGTPLDIFIRVLTRNDAANLEINTFLENTGTMNWLRQSTLEFNINEIKLAYLVTMMIAHMSNKQSQQSVSQSLLLK